jgi:hypothetical protein
VWNLAICRSGLGAVTQAEGDLEAALSLYMEGLELFRDTGDTWSLARILRRVADVGVDLGDQRLVSSTAHEAAGLGEILKDAHAPAELHRILARNAAISGATHEALTLYFKSAQIYVRLGRHRAAVKNLNGATALLLESGQFHAAGRARGVVQQLLELVELGNLMTPGVSGPSSVNNRVEFAIGFDTGFRNSPHSELDALLKIVEGS